MVFAGSEPGFTSIVPPKTSGQAENLWTGFLHKDHSLKRYQHYGFNELFMLLGDSCCYETSGDSGLDMKISDQCAPSLLSYETLPYQTFMLATT